MRTPGVYVEEISSGVRTIAPAPFVTALVGTCDQGPLDAPTEISGLADFTRTFGPPAGDLARAVSHFFQNGGGRAVIVRASALPGSATGATGIYALDAVPSLGTLVLPGQDDPALQATALAYAQARHALYVLDLPADANTIAAGETWLAAHPELRKPNAAAFIPRVLASDKDGQIKPMPNSGAVAGIIARTDSWRGIWKAPAGIEATISGVSGLDGDTAHFAERLNPLGLGSLRAMTDGPVVWTARTLAGADQFGSEWKYVPVRRTALFIEQSVSLGLAWAVFEPNDERLWAQVRLNVGAFMQGLFRQSAFQGETPPKAYFVKCDASTMTAADIADGRLNLEIGFAPLKPAEFVILRISQLTGQAAT